MKFSAPLSRANRSDQVGPYGYGMMGMTWMLHEDSRFSSGSGVELGWSTGVITPGSPIRAPKTALQKDCLMLPRSSRTVTPSGSNDFRALASAQSNSLHFAEKQLWGNRCPVISCDIKATSPCLWPGPGLSVFHILSYHHVATEFLGGVGCEVTSPAVVLPHLTPPSKPTASLVVKDLVVLNRRKG